MTSSAGLPQTQFAPDFKLVVWHFGLGVFGFVATAAACLFAAQTAPGHWFQAPLLGVVHIAALFWFFPIAMGALHQMVPVLFEVPIHSEKLSWVALLLLVLGASGLVAHMFTLKMGTGMAGTGVLTAVSVWVYAWNLLRTIQKSTKRDLVGRHVRVSLFFLILAITIGAALAFNFWKPILPTSHLWWLPAHAHLAIFGFFGLLIMGVGYKLAEMFLLAYGHSESDGRRAFWLMSLGLLILSVSFILNWNPNPGLLFLIPAVWFFGKQFGGILSRRLKKRLDVPWQHTLATIAWLSIALLLGVCIQFGLHPDAIGPRAATAYGLVAIFGFVASVISGQMFKILPFLVWLKWFSPLLGMKEVRPATELVPLKGMSAQFYSQQGGVLFMLLGILFNLPELVLFGAWLFLASALIFSTLIIQTLRARP